MAWQRLIYPLDANTRTTKRIGDKTMTRKELKELLPIMQAWAEGKTIQCNVDDIWRDAEIDLDLSLGDISKFRIKPEPKYRPFKTKEECWQEMLKHQPFGWIKQKENMDEIVHIGRIFESSNTFLITLSIDDGYNVTSSYLFSAYTFADGAPFGVMEE